MKDLLIPLMQEYQRLIEIEKKYDEWKSENPDKNSFKYNGQRISTARFQRIGIMIRQTMIDMENNQDSY